jgi:hypothetical protein
VGAYSNKVLFASGLLIFTLTVNANAQDTNAAGQHTSMCGHSPRISIPETKLLHLDSPNRIPNAFMVAFKCDEALAKDIPKSSALRSQVLPGTMPTSQANCAMLAAAFVARFGGHLGNVWCNPGFRAFSITEVSEATIAILAKDDRVEYVEPDMVATAQ